MGSHENCTVNAVLFLPPSPIPKVVDGVFIWDSRLPECLSGWQFPIQANALSQQDRWGLASPQPFLCESVGVWSVTESQDFFFLFSLKVHSFQNKELTSQSYNSLWLLLNSGSLIPFLVFYSFCAQKKPYFFPYFSIFGARILLDLKLLVLESQLDW